jgi:hypothetical protein
VRSPPSDLAPQLLCDALAEGACQDGPKTPTLGRSQRIEHRSRDLMADRTVDDLIRMAEEELEFANRIAESRTPAFHLSRAQVFALIATAVATENQNKNA